MHPIPISRRSLLVGSAGFAAAMTSEPGAAADAVTPVADGELAWYDVSASGVEGRAWDDTASYYDRLPARAEQTVPAQVWALSRESAGMLARFETDATAIRVRYTLGSEMLARATMAATGSSGVDLYGRDDNGRDRWLGTARPESPWLRDLTVDYGLVSGLAPGRRLYTLHLPLRNQVLGLEIGVATDTAFTPTAPRTDPPIVFYGTSIMHGSCASRPGMAITAQVGRRLGRPTVNLGFAAAGRMDLPIADLLAELDPAAYVIDCLPNMNATQVAERTEPLVHRLRAARPDTPILLVEDRTLQYAWASPAAQEQHTERRQALHDAYRRLHTSGVKNLAYLKGDGLLGDDGEATTDGSHPSDLGMVRYTDAYVRALRPLIG